MLRAPCSIHSFPFQQFDLVSVRVVHKGHLPSRRKRLTPISRPDFDAFVLETVAKRDEVRYADRKMHQILGYVQFVIVRIGQFERMGVARQFQVYNLVSRRGLLRPALHHEAEMVAIERRRPVQVVYPNPGMEKYRHRRLLSSIRCALDQTLTAQQKKDSQ